VNNIDAIKRILLAVVSICALSFSASAGETLTPAEKHALAPIAPAHRWVVQLEVRANSHHNWFDEQGNRRPLGYEFNGIDLNGAVFPALTLFGPGASLGSTALNTNVALQRAQFTLGYGVTDHLTLGAIINYGRTRTMVNFAVQGGNIGFNPLFNPGLPPGAGNIPFAPVSGGTTAPVGANGVNNILTNPVFGFGYQPIGSTTTREFGDLTLGGLWRFYSGDFGALVAGFGVRKSLAGENNPDNLFDVPLDDGSTDILAQIEYFHEIGQFLDMRLLVKKTIQLPDHITSRVAATGSVLALAASKESLARNLGDFWEYDLEVGVRAGNWRFSTTWHRYLKKGDHYYSARGQNTASLALNSTVRADQWRAAISWSGIESWINKDIPMPLVAKLELQETFRGKNMPDVRDIYLLITSFF